MRTTASWATTQRSSSARADDRLLVEGQERARVDDLDRDPVGLPLRRRPSRLVDERPVATTVTSSPSRWTGLADLDAVDLVRHLALEVVERPVLEEDDRVVVVDRAPEEPARVAGSRGEDHLDPGHVDEPRLELLGVLRARRPAGAALRPQRERHLDLAPDM